MFRQLVNHNEDIRRLVEKGYAVSVDSGYLVIRDIPYLDENKNLQIGAFVSKLDFIDQVRVKLHDHQIFFCGSHPCQLDGSHIGNLNPRSTSLNLTATDIKPKLNLSAKPKGSRYTDLFHKIENYVTIISGPAIELHGANPLTFRVSDQVSESVFKLSDTLTSRAEIGDLALKFKDDVVAIIGLGGTGSHILDFLVKTPVKEIRGFDLDWFHVHNAFRSPGKLDTEELGKRKAEVYQNRYHGFRHGVKIDSKLILGDSIEDMEGVTFAFVCVDKGSSRKEIFDLLIKLSIPFIDVGMGLSRTNGPITGMLRTTYFGKESGQEIMEKRYAQMSDDQDDIYKTNIQVSELNALNACLAVVRFKQLRGFYSESNPMTNILMSIEDFHLVGE